MNGGSWLWMDVDLVRRLEHMTLACKKRSFCEAFMDSESKEESRTKMSTRLQLEYRMDIMYMKTC